MAKQKIFYSYHYAKDANVVGLLQKNDNLLYPIPTTEHDWDTIKKGGDSSIEKWFEEQTKYTSCLVVLIGTETANRKWVSYEIKKSWSHKMGIVGIYIHTLKDTKGEQSEKGPNPFTNLNIKGLPLSGVIKTYEAPFASREETCSYINNHIEDWVTEAIEIRKSH